MKFLVVLVLVIVGFVIVAALIKAGMQSVDETWTQFAEEFGLSYNGEPDDARLSGTYRSRPVEIHRKKTSTGSEVSGNRTLTVQVIHRVEVALPVGEDLVLYDDPGRQGAMAEMVVDSMMGGGDFKVGRDDFDDHFDVTGGGDLEQRGGHVQEKIAEARDVGHPDDARRFFDHDRVVEALRILQEETTRETRIYPVAGTSNALKLIQMNGYDSLEDVRQNLDALVNCADQLDDARDLRA